MQKLSKIRKQYTYDYIQMNRYGNVAIYKASPYNYEVIKIKVREEETIQGRKYSRREVYPSNSEWGTLGFTFMSSGRALEKFNELAKQEHQKMRRHPSTFQKAVKIGKLL